MSTSIQLLRSCTVQVSIGCDWRDVCGFLREPRNYPRWASWLGPKLALRGGDWVIERPGGPPVIVRFTERNAFGVADHHLLESEERESFVALRALPNGNGSEVMATFFARASDAMPDAAAAERDLRRLKGLLEDGFGGRA